MGTFENNPFEKLDWSPVDDAVAKYAPRFWGIDIGKLLIPYPQSTEYKLGYLRKTLEVAPNLSDQTLAWIHGRRQKTVPGIGNLLKRPVKLPLDIRNTFANAPKTNQEAYKITQIRGSVHSSLATAGSPIEYVYQKYVEYGDANKPDIPKTAEKIGYAALELFVFAAGGDAFARLVQETTTSFYAQQQVDIARKSVDYPAAM